MAENTFSALAKIFSELSVQEKGTPQQALLADAANRFNSLVATLGAYLSFTFALGTYVVPTESGLLIVDHLTLTGSQSLTVQGTGIVRAV